MSTNLLNNDPPDPTLPSSRKTAARRVLSCTSCRQRKIKCDKANPCDPCLEYGLECTYPTRRARAPRIKRDALRVRDEELLMRIRHLESMLTSNHDSRSGTSTGQTLTTTSNERFDSPSSWGGISSDATEAAMAVDDHYSDFIKQQGSSSRHLNSSFWSSLSSEFDSLRQLIEGQVDEEDEIHETSPSSTDTTYSPPHFILHDPHSVNDAEIKHPPSAHSVVLFQFYFKNVDPVCKILHRPTVNAYFSNLKALFDPSTSRFKFRSLEAVTFAVYLAAVTSMSSDECLEYFGENRIDLSARYKRYTEIAMVQADFMNSHEITTLQSLTIYIMARRLLNRGRSNWAIVGLAMRIACGLGLHQDGDGQGFNAFEAEMRRRLFWQILVLDMRASEDRGFEPGTVEHSHNTAMPHNLNDEDFGHGSQYPLNGRTGHTSMTLCLLEMDALYTASRINSRSSANDARTLALPEGEDLIRAYAQRVESTYLANSHALDQQARLLHTMGRFWIHKLWLVLYYPLHDKSRLQHVHSSTQGLETAVAFLKSSELIQEDRYSANFGWLFKTYALWHGVAVTLAEICNQPSSALANMAWELVQSHFQDWSSNAAGTMEAMLWGPIKTLWKRAGAARQDAETVLTSQQSLEPFTWRTNMSNLSASTPSMDRLGENGDSADYHGQSFDSSQQAMNQPLEPFSFASTNSLVPNPLQPDLSSNLAIWNDFTYDVNTLGEEYQNGMAFTEMSNPGFLQ